MTTSLASIIIIVIFAFLLIIGVPIAATVALASIPAVLLVLPQDVALFTSAQKMVASLDSFSLLAVPFFVLSGVLMNVGGIAIKLVDLAKLIAGPIPGALAHTNIIGNMFFGSISGSAIAASTAIGGVIIPLEKEEGYDPNFAAAVNISSAPTGMMIPPSTAFIIYSLVSGGTSIAALFLGGYFIGIAWGLATMVVAFIIAKKNNYPTSPRVSKSQAKKVVIDAIPSIILVIIIVGGIFSGIFTAIEASAVAVVYTIFLALVYYRSVKVSQMPAILMQGVEMTGTIMILIATSSIMSFVFVFTGIPQAITEGILSVSSNPYVILFMINIILLVVGTFMDISPAILIFTPIFLPIVTSEVVGLDPVHFGLILVFNLCIGTITPPVGTGLFVGAAVAKVKFEDVIKPLLPFYAAIIAILFLITYVPSIPMFFANLAK